jgi:hypothetical protein
MSKTHRRPSKVAKTQKHAKTRKLAKTQKLAKGDVKRKPSKQKSEHSNAIAVPPVTASRTLASEPAEYLLWAFILDSWEVRRIHLTRMAMEVKMGPTFVPRRIMGTTTKTTKDVMATRVKTTTGDDKLVPGVNANVPPTNWRMLLSTIE